MKTIKIPYIQYQTSAAGDTWSEWVPATLTLNEEDKLQSIAIETHEGPQLIDVSSIAVLRCIDPQDRNLPTNVFWYVLNSEKFLYRAEYKGSIKGCAKASPVRSSVSAQKAVSMEALKTLTEADYNAMVAEADRRYQDSQRRPEDLLSIEEIENSLIRPADAVVRERLTDEVDIALERTRQFQKQCDEAYLRKIKEALSALVTANTNYSSLKNALKAFLVEHTELQNSSLAYTALPHHPVTQLLICIAERIGAAEGKAAITYLLPRVYTESLLDESLNLDALRLEEVFSTHILDSSQQYLLPVNLVLENTIPNDEESSLLMNPQRRLMNPYYAQDHDTNETHALVTPADVERLYQHSPFTQSLRDAYRRYQKASSEPSTLLGQLNTLIPILKLSDAHAGVGQQKDAAGMAYPAIIAFMGYYRALNPMGIYLSNTKPTTSEVLPEDRHIGYVLVSDGEDAGLYCVNRYDQSIKQCCDANTQQRYPIDLIRMEIFQDTEELRAKLSQEHPTLIQVGEAVKSYRVYGRKQGSEVFEFTEINLNTKTRFPNQLNRCVTLALGNVPDDVYQAINDDNAHHETARVIDLLKEKYKTRVTTCDSEDLHLIQTHTGHLDLSEFSNVPEDLRNQINALWEFIQNPAKNTSAVQDFATCIGKIRENLEQSVRANSTTLNAIRWSQQATKDYYQDSLQALKESRKELQDALTSELYSGADLIPPSPAMLKYLGIRLTIQTPADLEWLYTFPPESLEAFLSDEENPDPKTRLQQECDSLENIIMMLIHAPTPAFAALLRAIDSQFENRVRNSAELAQILIPLSEDKCVAFLEALKALKPNGLLRFIKNGANLKNVLQNLSPENCAAVCVTLKDRLAQIITSGLDFQYVLEHLTSEQRTAVYEGFKNEWSRIISTGLDFKYILRHITPEQRTVVYENFKDGLLEIIKQGGDFKQVLEHLTPKQRTTVYESFKDQLPEIIKSGQDFQFVLEYLRPEQRTAVYESFKGQLPEIIKSGLDFQYVLQYLTTGERTAVYEDFKNKWSRIIRMGTDFYRVSLYLTLDQKTIVYENVKHTFYKIIKNSLDFKGFLNSFRPEECIDVCKDLKDRLTQMIQSPSHISSFLDALSFEQLNAACLAWKAQLPEIIKSLSDLNAVLQNLSPKFCAVVCATLEGHLLDIIKIEENSLEALNDLSANKRLFFYAAVKNCLLLNIKSGKDFGNFLESFTQSQRTVIYEAFKNCLIGIIKSELDFQSVLKCLTPSQMMEVLEVSDASVQQLKSMFLRAHNNRHLSFFSLTRVKNNWSLNEILNHARENNSGARATCISLGWLNNSGGLADSTPLDIKKLYYAPRASTLAAAASASMTAR